MSPSDLKSKVSLETKRELPKEFINRHTFAKVINPVTGKGSYKYIGTFKEYESIDQKIKIYKRVSDEITINRKH